MAQGADFRSRITLEGGDKIVTDLQKIGTEGDKAFSQVGKAADASTSQVNSFAKATEGMARQMANLRSATSKAGQDLAQIGKHASDFGGELRNVANNVIPGFKEVLGLATVGGIAGFFKLFENTAKWAHELEENSKLLGLTPGQFGLIAKAAKEAGIDVDVLAKGMLRFGNAMEKAGEERQKLFGELAKDVLGAKTAVSQAGVDIMRGGLKPGEQPKGPQARMIEVPRLDNFKQQAEEAYASLRALNAIPKTVTLENWLSQISKKLMEGGNAAAKVREDLNKIGANLPVTKLGEQIDQALPGFKDLFAQLNVGLFDKATGALRPLTDTFGDFLDKFKLRPQTEQTSLVMKTMGRGALDLIPIMKEGREGLLKFFDAARAAGVDTSPFDADINKLNEAFKATNRLNAGINAVRKAFVVPFADVFTPILNTIAESLQKSQPEVKAWATGIANDVKVAVLDIIAVWRGAEPQTDFGRGAVQAFQAIQAAIGFVTGAFNVLVAAFQPFVSVLNSTFGVDYSAKTYALAAAFLYLSGIIPALVTGFTLLINLLQFFLTTPLGVALAILGAIALEIYKNWDTLGPLFKQTWQTLVDFANWVGSGFVEVWNTVISTITGLWRDFTSFVGNQVQTLIGWINSLRNLLPGGAAGAAAPTGMATGGQVPGVGSGDTFPAMLTPGEFVMRRSVVDSLGAPFFAALNRGMGSFVPRNHFATGGLAAVGATGGAPVHLHLGGQEFALSGQTKVVDALVTEAHRQRMRSGGLKPSWYGGRVSG
jgi:hypothetical protein